MLVVALSACSEQPNAPQNPTDNAIPFFSVYDKPSPGLMLSGAEAFEANWQDALQMASRGDSGALRGMQSLQALSAEGRASSNRSGSNSEASSEEEGSVSGGGDAVIYSSNTFPLLGSPKKVGSYVNGLFTVASTTAEYKFSALDGTGGEWASFGENNSAPRRIHTLSHCASTRSIECFVFHQQDASFSINGGANCGQKLWGRGNHSVSFHDATISGGYGALSFSFTVQNPAAHAVQADVGSGVDMPACPQISPFPSLVSPIQGNPCETVERRVPRSAGAAGATFNEVECRPDGWYCNDLYYGEWDPETGYIYWVEGPTEFCWDDLGNKTIGPAGFGDDGPVYRVAKDVNASGESRTPSRGGQTDYRAILFATANLANGQPTEVVKTQGPGAALLVIAVDTLRATNQDLAAAVSVAKAIARSGSMNNVYIRSGSSRTSGRATLDVNVASAFNQAKKSRVVSLRNLGTGRTADFALPH
jgi:hypothetical protein